MRLSTELVVAFAVGGGLGYGLDALAGTGPWGLLAGLAFGFAAGVRGVMRASAQMQAAATAAADETGPDGDTPVGPGRKGH